LRKYLILILVVLSNEYIISQVATWEYLDNLKSIKFEGQELYEYNCYKKCSHLTNFKLSSEYLKNENGLLESITEFWSSDISETKTLFYRGQELQRVVSINEQLNQNSEIDVDVSLENTTKLETLNSGGFFFTIINLDDKGIPLKSMIFKKDSTISKMSFHFDDNIRIAYKHNLLTNDSTLFFKKEYDDKGRIKESIRYNYSINSNCYDKYSFTYLSDGVHLKSYFNPCESKKEISTLILTLDQYLNEKELKSLLKMIRMKKKFKGNIKLLSSKELNIK